MSTENPSTTTDATNTEATGYWGWFANAKTQALELAAKAQELAETAGKVAHEKATQIAKQAQELRDNYDLETASSILMGTVGGPIDPSNPTKPTTIKLTKADLNQLDMIYVTENLIAMAFPREAQQLSTSQDGNNIDIVSTYLKKKHQGRFMVWNISEESYDYAKFNDQVLEYKFPGHPAPPLGLLFKICTSVESWLDADEQNVAILHCLTGKGRTATLMACVLAWIGEFDSPIQALNYISQRRCTTVDYLTIPSQRRYIQYFSNMLDGVKPNPEPLLLRRILINSVPTFGADENGSEGCCPYIQLFKNGKLIISAAATSEKATDSNNTSDSKTNLKWISTMEGNASFRLECAVQGDILIRCRHCSTTGAKISMFRAAFHTGYISGGVLRLTKAQLDGTAGDPRYPEDFFIDLIFSPFDPSSLKDMEADGLSSDKYETGIHKDIRFWEAISLRKSKSKKRRSRKFDSNEVDQFSIADDGKFLLEQENGVDEISFLSSATDQSSLNVDNSELIKQLALAEEDELPSMTLNDTTTAAKQPEMVPGELQVLEDLEKELGLSDLQLFSAEKNPHPPSPKETQSTDDDNLDELEKYLQSLTATN